MKSIMALCDKDEEYVYRLQELLSRRESFPFTVSSYTDREAFRQEMKNKRFSIVVASEGFYTDARELDRDGDTQLILLKSTEDENENTGYIRKYQSGEKIRQEIMENYAPKGTDIKAAGNKKTKVYGVFSPICREVQTSFSKSGPL